MQPSTLRLMATAASALLVATACGSDAPQASTDTIASLVDPAATTTSVDSADEEATVEEVAVDDDTTAMEAPENPEDAFALFDECLSDAGFGGSSIIVGGADGDSGAIAVDDFDQVQEFDPQDQSFEDFDIEAFEEASAECEGHLANIDGGFDLSPEQQAAFEDAQLEFADCMREQGVDVPDFDSNGGFTIGVEVAESDVDPQSGQPDFGSLDFDFEAFEAAAESCDHVFSDLEELAAGDDQ